MLDLQLKVRVQFMGRKSPVIAPRDFAIALEHVCIYSALVGVVVVIGKPTLSYSRGKILVQCQSIAAAAQLCSVSLACHVALGVTIRCRAVTIADSVSAPYYGK